MYARVEERLLAQTALEDVVFIYGGFLEYLGIRLEAHLGALDVRLADLFELIHYLSALIALEVHVLAVADLDLEPFGESIDDGCAYAVQTAGDLVAAAAELASGVEHGEYHRHRRKSRLAVNAYRYASSVVGDADDVALLDHDVDL